MKRLNKYKVTVAREVRETSYQEVEAESEDLARQHAIHLAESDNDADAWESTDVGDSYVMDIQKTESSPLDTGLRFQDFADMEAARALLDVAHNIAGVDADWLAKASPESLRSTIKEIQADARAALDKTEAERN